MIRKKVVIQQQAARISELEEQLNKLTQENQNLKIKVDGIEERERCIGRTLTEATASAHKTIEDAQREAGAMLEQSRQECDTAQRDAEILVDDAYQNARDIVKEAEASSKQTMDDTHARLEAYAALLNGYDKLVQENIRMAEDSAKRYAELAHALHASVPQLFGTDGKLIHAAQPAEAMPEPMPEEEPAPVEEAAPVEEPEADEELEADEEPAAEAEAEEPKEFYQGTRSTPIEERMWTVGEIAEEEAAPTHVDDIIDDILQASKDGA